MDTAKGGSRTGEASASHVNELAGKYLTFVLGEGEYGVAVRKVREIIKLPPITAVPQVASWVKGVINLRGKVIPVLDLRLKFNVAAADYTDRTCIVVVDIAMRNSTMLMGIIVDTVSDVMSVAADELEEAPTFGDRTASSYVDGLAKVKGSVKILLNVDRVCGSDNEIGSFAPSVVPS